MKALEHIQDIGEMDELIDILTHVTEENDFGEELQNVFRLESTIFSAWRHRSQGVEENEAGQIRAHRVADVTIRYFPGLTERHRIVRQLDMTDWEILRINMLGRKRYMQLRLALTSESWSPEIKDDDDD